MKFGVFSKWELHTIKKKKDVQVVQNHHCRAFFFRNHFTAFVILGNIKGNTIKYVEANH